MCRRVSGTRWSSRTCQRGGQPRRVGLVPRRAMIAPHPLDQLVKKSARYFLRLLGTSAIVSSMQVMVGEISCCRGCCSGHLLSGPPLEHYVHLYYKHQRWLGSECSHIISINALLAHTEPPIMKLSFPALSFRKSACHDDLRAGFLASKFHAVPQPLSLPAAAVCVISRLLPQWAIAPSRPHDV